jgi:hypothetical protein
LSPHFSGTLDARLGRTLALLLAIAAALTFAIARAPQAQAQEAPPAESPIVTSTSDTDTAATETPAGDQGGEAPAGSAGDTTPMPTSPTPETTPTPDAGTETPAGSSADPAPGSDSNPSPASGLPRGEGERTGDPASQRSGDSTARSNDFSPSGSQQPTSAAPLAPADVLLVQPPPTMPDAGDPGVWTYDTGGMTSLASDAAKCAASELCSTSGSSLAGRLASLLARTGSATTRESAATRTGGIKASGLRVMAQAFSFTPLEHLLAALRGRGGGGAGALLFFGLAVLLARSVLRVPEWTRVFRISTATWRPSAYVPPIEQPG